MEKPAIQIIETRHGCAPFERQPRYLVMFRGEKYGELYFNMTGYTGCYLPGPDGLVDVGEYAISRYRKVAAQLNKEWAAREGKS